MRVGIGHDTHRMAEGGTLRLGGIDIDADCHLIGHSDADVLLHAITDALLGASALGDIGELFSDTDPAHRGRDSGRNAADRRPAGTRQLASRSIISTVLYSRRNRNLVRTKNRSALRSPDCCSSAAADVSVKAKTGEGVGEVGRGEVMMAQAVVLLDPQGKPSLMNRLRTRANHRETIHDSL